ncbi:MAG: DnaA ATPase domain-containing protein [Alphaproteobacteria bacterium]
MQLTAKSVIDVEKIKDSIAQQIDSAAFTSWIVPLEFQIEDNVLNVGALNQFSLDYVKSVFGAIISDVAKKFDLSLGFSVQGKSISRTKIANDNNVQSYAPAKQVVKDDMVAFDSFVESEKNAFVISACKRIAIGSVSFSPLFIYGAAGCGKSLLAECIRSEAKRAILMSGGQFIAEFTRALHNKTIFAFKDFCRNCDVFILDDVQALAGKTATMDEFLQLVMDLRGAGKNVVLTSNCAPNQLTGFDRRAQSILASGLVADVAMPDDGVKTEILKRAGVKEDVANSIAKRITNNGHMITGVANKIRTYIELMGTSVTMAVAEKLLADTLEKFKTPIVMVKDMCEKLGVSYDAICGKGRSRALVLARQIMMVVLKNATHLSLAEIGQYVGDRDHATVVYAIHQIEKLQQTDLVLSTQINQLVDECK